MRQDLLGVRLPTKSDPGILRGLTSGHIVYAISLPGCRDGSQSSCVCKHLDSAVLRHHEAFLRQPSQVRYTRSFRTTEMVNSKPRATPTIGAVCLSALLLGVFSVATLLNLAPAKQTIGWTSAYILFGIAPPLVLALLERLTAPAGPRKSTEKWLLHFQIMLVNYAAAIPFGLLATYLASLLVRSLGLNVGLLDLRIGDGKACLSTIAALIVSALIGDFFFIGITVAFIRAISCGSTIRCTTWTRNSMR